MRQILRKLYLGLFGSIVKPSNSIHILNMHYINEIDQINDAIIFEKLLIKLSKSFELINFEDAISKIKNNKKTNSPELALTFDDGYLDCYNSIFPTLKKFNLSACFFIIPGIIDYNDSQRIKFIKSRLFVNNNKSFLSWNQIKEMKNNGQIIGNHTMNHLALKGLSYKGAYNEINSSKLYLEKKLNFNCKYFAFPYGNSKYFDSIAIKAALKCHDLIFTSGDYDNYFYDSNFRILNRRHAEGSWPISHINYFLSKNRSFIKL